MTHYMQRENMPIHSFNRRFKEGRWDYTVKHQMSNEKNDTNPDRLQNFLITQAGPDAGKERGIGKWGHWASDI